MNGTEIKTTNHDRVLVYINSLIPLQGSIEKIIKAKNYYQVLLLEPKLLFKNRKDFVCFLIALRLYNQYKSSVSLAKGLADSYISEIAKYDREFAEQVKAIVPTFANKGMFADLIGALGQGRKYFTSYISTNLDELNTKAKSVEDIRISKQLVSLFSIISGHEINILMRYVNDSKNWPNYSLNHDINFFIRRLELYLRGGFEANERYMGIVNDFGDIELGRSILKNPQIRNLWKYNNQIRYLGLLIRLCVKSEASGAWTGFWGKNYLEEKAEKDGKTVFFGENDKDVGFWGREGDGKGKNFDRHAELFKINYGNSDFRDLLMAKKYEIGESPEGWGGKWQEGRLVKPGFLHTLLAKLLNREYQLQKIIIPASGALYNLLKRHESELMNKIESSVDELVKLLENLSGIGLSKDKVLSRFKGLLKRKKRIMLGKLNEDVDIVASKARHFAPNYQTYMENLDTAIVKIDPSLMLSHLEKLYRTSMNNLKFVWHNISRADYLNDIVAGVMTTGADRAAQVAWIQRSRIIRFEHLSEENFTRLQELVEEARGILAILEMIYSHISDKLKNDYINVNDLINADIESMIDNMQNKELEFGYVKERVKNLI